MAAYFSTWVLLFWSITVVNEWIRSVAEAGFLRPPGGRRRSSCSLRAAALVPGRTALWKLTVSCEEMDRAEPRGRAEREWECTRGHTRLTSLPANHGATRGTQRPIGLAHGKVQVWTVWRRENLGGKRLWNGSVWKAADVYSERENKDSPALWRGLKASRMEKTKHFYYSFWKQSFFLSGNKTLR